MNLNFTTKLFLLISILAGSCITGCKTTLYPKTEYRAIWIATVANIDWPSDANRTTVIQKEEFINLLDFYKELNFNVVIVQVRTSGDAFYESSYEPWSRYLTGEQGKAPEPYYDPLEWMVKEAHKRGFEFHAWFNPYRATLGTDTLALADNHAFMLHREWMVRYGKKFYFNPGLPEVRNYTTDVIMEVVNKYDIDGVHFDDYFYPYKIKNETFPDSVVFAEQRGQIENIEDWRRANVDSLIKDVSDSIQAVKPWVQFGISPFGVWRNASADPAGSDTHAGQTNYDDLYANPLLWMNNRWIDYVVPQIYWSMDYPAASHSTLVRWWANQPYDGHLYIGHGLYKVKQNADKAWNRLNEIPNQIALTREKPRVDGSVFFSAVSLQSKPERLTKRIARSYKYPALPPPSPFVICESPREPEIEKMDVTGDTVTINFKTTLESLRYIMVYGVRKKQFFILDNPELILLKKYIINDKTVISLDKASIQKLHSMAFTTVDKYGYESEPVSIDIERINGNIVIH